jgi:tetratricopeptide (TPR) repeat protein
VSDRNSAHEHYLRGLDLEEADRLAAKAAYEACLAGDCSHLEARINLGRLLHLEGMHADAETIYRDTQEADATLFFNLAVLMEDLGRESDAIKYYHEAIVHDPGLADAHFNLSMLQERRGETQGAYRHLLAYHRLIEAHRNPADFRANEAE